MSKTLVIYHGKCIDGFTAAWVCWRKFGDEAEYYPGIYQEPSPDVAGKDVVMVDFSYKFDAMVEIVMAANSVLVLDHHKSAQEDLKGLAEATHKDKVNIVFDMDRCGAGIAWDYFFSKGKQPWRPWLIDYVEDRDLWRWDLPRSRDISAYIAAVDQDFLAWDKLAHSTHWTDAADRGSAVVAYVDRYVREMCEQTQTVDFESEYGNFTVPVVNAPYINISELCGALAETQCQYCEGRAGLEGRDKGDPLPATEENMVVCPNCENAGHVPFSIGWFQRGDGKYHYSLRSRGNFDVSALATKYGGGGHKNAAGFVSDERVI
jgi:hypothetical protein